ncbi:Glycosyltransferase involved in cell wall bisynthesis [Sanguibacter gelidistatuariae]|uniref:Glycosyltransferase involved in cell wall bisynthesis n=1 Tax=Sanguibacter gelidistatuariae TaxID=1814289 RepID=A0A1G6XUK9_9MICO|nr:glycosyltransferase family 1 protein [Sanguibacter gelidistatuariae]SDD81820.1 Glycosyltransferase involved in cell wall bisynthesis [Sanguibacter gelidistatuariae]
MTAHPGTISVALTVEQLWQPVPGGSGTYIRALTAALSVRDELAVTGVRARPSRRGDDDPSPLQVDVVASHLPRRALYEAWNKLRRPSVPRTPALRHAGRGYDVVHATTWAIPPRSAPLVVTIHDVAFLRSPEHFTPRGVSFFQRALDIARTEADIVIVPSETTRLDCLEAGIREDRLQVIHHGTTGVAVSSDDVAQFRRRHRLEREYVLWCGTLEPRKNLPTLLASFDAALTSGADLDLVLVGPSGWGGTSDDVRRLVQALPADRVHTLGRLDDDDLQLAYAGARVFCFPSLWEGFGMPILEAMNHGIPVVTSRGTSMEEVSGDAAILVDPLDVDSMAQALVEAAGPAHDRLSAAARPNAARYTWEASAEKHVTAYHEAAAAWPISRNQL